MAYLSDVLNRTVTDLDGNYIGKIEDLIARELKEFKHPIVDAVMIRTKKQQRLVPYSTVTSLFAPVVPLNCRIESLPVYEPAAGDIYLSRDVLDKQIIDTDGARVVRVNDVELMRVNGTLYVSNVDIGLLSVLRRFGLGGTTAKLAAALHISLGPNAISWDNVELLSHDPFMRLRVPADKINDLHPADIAEILSDMNQLARGQFIESMPVEQLADTMEQVESDFQKTVLETMDNEKAADVLEEMEPDEAADLLAELSKERSKELLALMQKEEAEDVRNLMTYPEDSAGGIMTTEYASVPPDVTAEQAIRVLRETASEAETVFYVYVIDPTEHLLGVFSLNNLIFADPSAPVSDFMEKRVKVVRLLDKQEEVAQVITKYDLLAAPVVDDHNVMQGIVTADDALDKIIPTAWKKRLPRFYR
jgi:magnesium transporter